MRKENNTPALRFPGFNDKWVENRIEDFIDFLSGYPFDGNDISDDPSGTPLMRGINISEGFIRHDEKIDRYYPGDPASLSRYILDEGDLVIGMDGSKVGKNSAIIDYKNANSLLVQRVARLRENQRGSLSFIYQHINSLYFHKHVDEVKTSSGIPHISSSQIKSFKISFPSLSEQKKIASFLTSVDEKLTQLKKQKSLLEQYKKGVMQKIFSQEIRFKDENGKEFPDWEEKKLSQLCKICYGKDQKMISDDKGQYPIFGTGGIIGRTNQFLYDKPSVLIGRKGTIDKPVFFDTPFWTVDTLFYTQIFEIVDPKWFFFKLQTINWYLYNEASGVPSLSGSTIYKIALSLPCLAEQTKIANFLSAIDDKINHCRVQIEKTEQWKKGLLQKMFC